METKGLVKSVNKKAFKHDYQIVYKVFHSKEISDRAKLIYTWQTNQNHDEDFSIKKVASIFGVSTRTIDRTYDELKKVGLLSIEKVGVGSGFVYHYVWFDEIRHDDLDTPTRQLRHDKPDKKRKETKEIKENNINNTTIKKENSQKEKESMREYIPTLNEIEGFIKDNKITSFTASEFFHFYQSKGWTIGTTMIVDWKSCLLGWDSRKKQLKNKPVNLANSVIEVEVV